MSRFGDMTTEIRGTTGVYGIVGWPVEHSLSPGMHTRAFARLGVGAVYVPFAVEAAHVPAALAGLYAAHVRGLNVTTPHKHAALECAVESSDTARRARSCNALLRRANGWHAHNTDGDGMIAALRDEHGVDVRGVSVRVLGAGGAGRSVIEACVRSGADRVDAGVRDRARARAALSSIDGVRVSDLDESVSPCDIVINTIPAPVWTADAASRVLEHCGPRVRLVIDASYARASALLDAARAGGIDSADGRGLLLHQGALTLAWWLGGEPPVAILREALEDARRAAR